MDTFKKFYLTEAYSVLPTSAEEVATLDPKFADELVKLYNMIQQQTNSAMKDPLAIDNKSNHKVKIARGVADNVDVTALKKEFPTLNIGVGNGSRGNQGAANRGNLFEVELADDVRKWIEMGSEGVDFMYPDFIKDFVEPELGSAKEIEVKDMGALNQKRPLVFKGSNIYVGSDKFNIGPIVTDVTLIADGKPYYLSLKMGSTVTFFNAGVRKLFPDSSFEKGEIENKQGAALLDMFGIDHDRFIKIFTEYEKPTKKKKADKDIVDSTRDVNMKKLHEFIKSGIGAGYWMVHKVKKKVHVHEIAESDLSKIAKPQSVKIQYPKAGGAKRIDVVVETPALTLKFNIRNKQGGLYPTHIMSDYSWKTH